METNDLVSIIIPCYNHAQHLEETVQSAIEQTYLNIEILIVNDGSTDDTQKVAEKLQVKHPEKIQVISQNNSGVSIARNNAIMKSQGQYILPLDADDMIDKYMISACMKSMINHDADIVYVNRQCFGVQTHLSKKVAFSENNILYENLCDVTSLYKKVIWEKLNGYAKNMREGYEDWEFWINAFKFGYKFQLLSEPFLLYRTQKVSRQTKAESKDAYLKAKITLNHPELYTINKVNKDMELIKEIEEVPDIYFYYPKDLVINEKYFMKTLSSYLTSTVLQKKQLITFSDINQNMNLYALDIALNPQHLETLYEKSKADFTIFYASLRYDVPSLQESGHAWDRHRGIVKTKGSIFPFVFKSTIENPKLQLLAYHRLVKYKNKQITMLENASKTSAIQKNIINSLNTSIYNLMKISVLKHPIKKYKAYKTMLGTFNRELKK